MAGHQKTPEEKAAWRAQNDAEREARKEAAPQKRAEKKRKHALLSKLPADVAAADCAPPLGAAFPAVAASALPAVSPAAPPEPLPAVPAVPAAEVVEASPEETRVEAGRRKIEKFYNDCLDSPDLNVRDKLIAAAQLGKVLGLEKQEIKVEVSQADAWVKHMRQAAAAPKKMPWEH